MKMRLFFPRAVAQRYQTTAASALPPLLRLDRLDDKDEGITLLRLFRPETRNAISSNFLDSLDDAMSQIRKDTRARVVVVKSDLKGTFCAGADLKERSTLNQHETQLFVSRTRGLINALSNLPIPVIAALDGVALGGGLELALACDIRIGATTAKMGLVETKLAIIPGAGGTQRLPRLIGPALAKELMFTGRILDGPDAFRLGLLNHLAEQNAEGDAAFAKGLELAREILPQGPVALRMVKKAVNTGLELDLPSGLLVEDLCYAQVVPTEDRLEGLRAFKEKRPPKFIGA